MELKWYSRSSYGPDIRDNEALKTYSRGLLRQRRVPEAELTGQGWGQIVKIEMADTTVVLQGNSDHFDSLAQAYCFVATTRCYGGTAEDLGELSLLWSALAEGISFVSFQFALFQRNSGEYDRFYVHLPKMVHWFGIFNSLLSKCAWVGYETSYDSCVLWFLYLDIFLYWILEKKILLFFFKSKFPSLSCSANSTVILTWLPSLLAQKPVLTLTHTLGGREY